MTLVPALAGLPVLSRGVGLRAARASVRLEHIVGRRAPVGRLLPARRGGATLSRGCAEAVVAPLQPPSPRPCGLASRR